MPGSSMNLSRWRRAEMSGAVKPFAAGSIPAASHGGMGAEPAPRS